jgi:hypothetical protein
MKNIKEFLKFIVTMIKFFLQQKGHVLKNVHPECFQMKKFVPLVLNYVKNVMDHGN